MISSEIGLDVAACDLEPIHIPGSIQPHGLLLVAEAGSLNVVAGAGDIESRLSADWLNRSLHDLLGETVGSQLSDMNATDGVGLVFDHVQGASERFDVIPHPAGAIMMVELEPSAVDIPSAISVLSAINAASSNFENTSDVRGVCECAAVAFRQLTGFDRIMIYRFLDDGAGVVLADAQTPELGSFLNHHFPASDIPKQARALYVRNRIRVIPDVDYVPAPIRSQGDWRSLDLSDVGLRSVSPIHIRYLKNMKVAASASISIVKDGRLWGLVACHNRTPKRITYDVRMVCLGLAGSLSRQIRAKEDGDIHRERTRLRSSEDAVAAQLGSDLSLGEFFATAGDHLCRMLGADGFAALQGSHLYAVGRCPARESVMEVATWVGGRAMNQPVSTHNLTSHLASAEAFQDLASGLLAVTISIEEPTILMWFRAEQREVVNWAGNPHKATFDPTSVLNPRSSFDAWSEAVRGQSRRWTLQEVEAAGRLRRALFDARQNRRLRDLNRELAATVVDKESLLRQKDFLIKEVNHRVQNSLQIVSSFLGLQARAVGEPVVTAQLGEAQRRLSAVALVHRRLYSDGHAETIDLARYLDDLCADMKVSMGGDWGENFAVELAPILISTDRAVNVGLILTELVINANKYAYGGIPGSISVILEHQGSDLRLSVADRGTGKIRKHQGFGTRLLTTMITGLSGRIEERNTDPGLEVVVTAPIEDHHDTVSH